MGNSTAKPRTITLAGGTVSLHGFPKEIANHLEVYILAFVAPVFVPSGNDIVVAIDDATLPARTEAYPDKAIGLREDGSKYELVVVGYNSNTKEAVVEEVRNAGDFRQHAVSVFQQEIFKRGII